MHAGRLLPVVPMTHQQALTTQPSSAASTAAIPVAVQVHIDSHPYVDTVHNKNAPQTRYTSALDATFPQAVTSHLLLSHPPLPR